MANSVQLDIYGPDWPLGFIKVVTPGTPVNIMSLVDASSVNAPNTLDPSVPAVAGQYEYSPSVYQIQFQALKPGASHGTQVNAGNVYIVRQGVGSGSGNRDDSGAIIATLTPGTTTATTIYNFVTAPSNKNTFSPYRYYIDADNANDGAYVTLFIV